MPTYPNTSTASEIITQVANELAIDVSADPYSGSLEGDRQLTALLNAAGRELIAMEDWNLLRRVATISTTPTDLGEYDLPANFMRILNQTGWDATEEMPLAGPLTAPQWAALINRKVVSTVIFGYRLTQNKVLVYPYDPVGVTKTFTYEYVSNEWVLSSDDVTFKNKVTVGDDKVLFNDLLVEKLLKYKWEKQKGFPSTSSWDDFQDVYDSLTDSDKGAPVLVTNADNTGFPFLDPAYNTSGTGYGGV